MCICIYIYIYIYRCIYIYIYIYSQRVLEYVVQAPVFYGSTRQKDCFCENLCYYHLKHSKSASRSVVNNGQIVPRGVCGHMLKP